MFITINYTPKEQGILSINCKMMVVFQHANDKNKRGSRKFLVSSLSEFIIT